MIHRIFKMIDTSGFLTALESTKFVFGRGSGEGREERKRGRGKEGKGDEKDPPYANSWMRP